MDDQVCTTNLNQLIASEKGAIFEKSWFETGFVCGTDLYRCPQCKAIHAVKMDVLSRDELRALLDTICECEPLN